MPLSAGTRVGSYVIGAPIGAGGMGEVYRARDTRLERDVALKIVPDAFARDTDRLARFEREAKTLAALNHPNIAHIHGIEDSGTVRALVMELVPGVTLAEMLESGRPLPVPDAIAIARQIVDALEAAHEAGIVHRDLKPANIKVRDEGTVKVLDFGLAKAVEPPRGSGTHAMNSPTFTSPATAIGIILGTAAYMAPEQARGKPVDKRADIWAFGCVLYEMLTGRRLFDASEVSDILAAVLRAEIDLAILPANTPRSVRRLIARCLERDPRRRLRDIGDARIELDDQPRESVEGTPAAVRRTPAYTLPIALALLTGAAVGAVVWVMKPEPRLPVRKLDILADIQAASVDTYELAPDGSRLAYVAGGHLWVRELSSVAARDLGALPERTNRIVWSPDARSVAYASGDGRIRTLPASGGAPVVVCEIPETRRIIGLAWVDDDLLMAVWRGSLYRINARGGIPAVWAAIDPKAEIDFHSMTVLPDGRAVFATHRANDQYTLEMWDGKTRSALLPPMVIGATAYSQGHLLFIRQDANPGLWAIPLGSPPLDPARAFLVDASAGVVSASNDGTLVVQTAAANPAMQLVIADRRGGVTKRLASPTAVVAEPAFSPDGQRVLVMRGSGTEKVELWVDTVTTGVSNRLTFGEQGDGSPAWFQSGNRILYTDHLHTVRGNRIVSLSADGSGQRRELVQGMRAIPTPDGTSLVYAIDENGIGRLRYAALGADGTMGPPQKVFNASPEPNIRDFMLSPDGRLLAYVELTAAGQTEVFLRRFPSGEGRWQPAMAGARVPDRVFSAIRFARSTGELIFPVRTDSPDRVRLMSVAVRDRGTLELGSPAPLFDVELAAVRDGFDVAPDGQSFVLSRPVETAPKGPSLRFVLVQHWLSEFGR